MIKVDLYKGRFIYASSEESPNEVYYIEGYNNEFRSIEDAKRMIDLIEGP